MWRRRITVMVACIVVSGATAPWASADPGPAAPSSDAAPADDASARSAPPVTTMTPDGCSLTVGSEDESQQPVPPLTTAITSREYVVGGTLVGTVNCPGN